MKIEKISRVAVNAFLRPMVSAMVPQTKAPRAMPIRFAVPIQAASPGLSDQCLDSNGIRMPLRVTSQASNMKPSPPIRKIRPWTFQRHGSSWTTCSPLGTVVYVFILASCENSTWPGPRPCACFTLRRAGRARRRGRDKLAASPPPAAPPRYKTETFVSFTQLDRVSIDRVPIRRALISVYDKTGLEELARGLHDAGVKIVSTGSTAKKIAAAGIPVQEVEEVTGSPEMLDGRVKTLHPRVHGGILADRRVPAHMQTLADMEIEPFDLVVVNLYPFVETVKSGAAPGRRRRADRHRRPRDGALRREEPRRRRDRGGPGVLRCRRGGRRLGRL